MNFEQTLNVLNGGALKGQAEDALARVVEAVQFVGKPGTVTIKLTIKPVPNSASGLTITGSVASSAPKPKDEPQIFFLTSDGELTLNNPRQLQLPLSAVPEATFQLKQA